MVATFTMKDEDNLKVALLQKLNLHSSFHNLSPLLLVKFLNLLLGSRNDAEAVGNYCCIEQQRACVKGYVVEANIEYYFICLTQFAQR